MSTRRVIVLQGGDIEEDWARVDAIIRGATTSATKTARRLLDQMIEYVRGQPPEKIKGMSVIDLRMGFIGRISEGKAPSTMRTYLHTMDAYGIWPGNECRALERIRHAELETALRRREAEVPTRTWPVRTREDLRAIVESSKQVKSQASSELEYRTFFYLCVATGGRPENILAANGVALGTDGLVMDWGRRKVPGGPRQACLWYPYDWSFRPPTDVANRIARLIEVGWVLPRREDIASRLNDWLRQKTTLLGLGKMTSTAGRRVMCETVYAELEQDSLKV